MLRCSGAKRLAKRIAAPESRATRMAPLRRSDRLAGFVSGKSAQLLGHRLAHLLRQLSRRGDQQRDGVGIVLGLRQQIRGDVVEHSPLVATTSTSVGPASMSMAQSPLTRRLAAVT